MANQEKTSVTLVAFADKLLERAEVYRLDADDAGNDSLHRRARMVEAGLTIVAEVFRVGAKLSQEEGD